MSVLSFQFLLPALALGGWFLLVPGLALRRALFAACGAAFVALCLPGYDAAALLAAFVLSGYGVARRLRARPGGAVLAAYVLVLVAAFLVVRKYDVVRPAVPGWVWAYPVATVGLSYVLFRQIHFLVDVAQGQIEAFSLASYLSYQLNPFGFLAGPIQRYQDFRGTWSAWGPVLATRHDVLAAFTRLFLGLAKVALSAQVFDLFDESRQWFLAAPVVTPGRARTAGQFLQLFYSYPAYLYVNFSGYCDAVIAAAALVGIRMPENFDRPYLSRNMVEYWTRFHRSLGFWIRDYLFSPMYKAAAERWPGSARWLVYPCYLVAFVLAGAWHGPSLNFVVFGVLHGCGASAVKAWESALLARGGRAGLKRYAASRPVRVAAVLLTLHFVCFTMLFFPHDLTVTGTILGNLARRLAR